MSHKKAPLYTKILIDIDEYYKLLELQERVNKQEEQINARLEKDNQSSTTSFSNNAPEQTIDNAAEQSGSGLQNFPLSEDIVKHISNLVTEQLSSKFQLKPIQFQEGAGASDLFPELPEPIINYNVNESAPNSLSMVHKSIPHDEFDNAKLINLIPKKLKERATKLLEELVNHSSDITWTSDGVIYLNQNSLPDSNIYEIFPKLFNTTSNPEKIMYLQEVATKIASLGLGHYISKKLTYGLIRKRKITNESEIMSKIKTAKNWWYLGP